MRRVISVSALVQLCLLQLPLAGPLSAAVCTQAQLFDPAQGITTGASPTQMVKGDFNGDGRVDIAVAVATLSNPGTIGSIAILLATGPRTYAPPVHYPVPGDPIGIASGDFNADGITDLAVASTGAHSVSIFLGQGGGGIGNGTFAAGVSYPAGASAFHIVVADFDRDGILDLATSSDFSPAVSVFRGLGSAGHGDGTFAAPVPFTLDHISTGIVAADFNHDGVLDLAATENSNGTIAVLLGTGAATLGSGSFGPPSHYSAGLEPFDLCVADFDHDSRPDIAVANASDGGVVVLRGDGAGGFSFSTSINSGNSGGIVPCDVDQDGIMDLAVAQGVGSGAGTVGVYLGQGAGGVGNGLFAGGMSLPIGNDPYQLAVGDLDGDGRLDILASGFFSNYIAILPGACHADARNPELTDVRDVPHDQGGHVFLTWKRSSLDAFGGSVRNYRVWRRIPPVEAQALLRSTATRRPFLARPVVRADGATDLEYWEALATLPAQRLPGYGYDAATTQDSLPGSNPLTAFFISALTDNIDVFFSSNVDSGYSVDNLRPGDPQAFVATLCGSRVLLAWERIVDADLAGYRLYRGGSADFVPSTANLIATPKLESFSDPSGGEQNTYKLSAIDTHGNESAYTVAVIVETAGAPGNRTPSFALHGSWPNPARSGAVAIAFTLATDEPARLELLDLAGRRISSRDLAGIARGDHLIPIDDARHLAPGIYVVRISQSGRLKEARVVVTR